MEEKLKPSIFCDLYKPTDHIDQNKRRETLLQEQKRRRENLLDDVRGINNDLEILEKVKQVPKVKNVKEYNHKIMLSEWLVEVPSDLDVSWFMKVCPAGHRNLVVTDKHSTKSYSRNGRFEYKFKSYLPGGFYDKVQSKYTKTILDCIWSEKNNTFYVLDVLVWADKDLTDCEAEMRFFWLQSKFSETPELEIPSSDNTYSFKYVPHTTCDYLEIKNSLENYPFYENNLPSVDGLLFYHKEASYSPGRTPLVGWLKPYMVPEIINIHVAQEYLNQKPEKYINLKEHIQYGKQMKERNKQRGSEDNVEMEIL